MLWFLVYIFLHSKIYPWFNLYLEWVKVIVCYRLSFHISWFSFRLVLFAFWWFRCYKSWVIWFIDTALTFFPTITFPCLNVRGSSEQSCLIFGSQSKNFKALLSRTKIFESIKFESLLNECTSRLRCFDFLNLLLSHFQLLSKHTQKLRLYSKKQTVTTIELKYTLVIRFEIH